MYKLKIGIKGKVDLLMHKLPYSSEEEYKDSKEVTKILQKNPFDKKAVARAVEMCIYRNEDGDVCFPAEWIEKSLERAAVQFKIPGQGKKTYMDSMKSQVLVEPSLIKLEHDGYITDMKSVTINKKSRILRHRPLFKAGWGAEFILSIFDDSVTTDIIEEIIRYAGFYGGLGDYRPKYGRFVVTSVEEVE